jgi:hypothetical protein
MIKGMSISESSFESESKPLLVPFQLPTRMSKLFSFFPEEKEVQNASCTAVHTTRRAEVEGQKKVSTLFHGVILVIVIYSI